MNFVKPGDRYGLWTIVGNSDELVPLKSRVLCKCCCGQERPVLARSLFYGKSKSCGCLQRASVSRHGKFGSRVYRIWQSMKSRCFNKTHMNYHRYGGRGISVCDEWRNSFDAFYRHMGDPPSESHSIDRFPDADGNYTPGNCRWATPCEQRENQPDVVFITCNGKTMTIGQWSRESGINQSTIRSRIRRGIPPEVAVTSCVDQATSHASNCRRAAIF